jgi:hypothetical protein
MNGKEALSISSKRELRAWLKEASDADIDDYIHGVSAAGHFWTYAIAERQRRQMEKLSKPHWTTVPNFWLTLIAALAAVIGLMVAVWVAWLQFHPHP